MLSKAVRRETRNGTRHGAQLCNVDHIGSVVVISRKAVSSQPGGCAVLCRLSAGETRWCSSSGTSASVGRASRAPTRRLKEGSAARAAEEAFAQRLNTATNRVRDSGTCGTNALVRWCSRPQTAESRESGGAHAQIAPNTTTSQGNPHSIPHGEWCRANGRVCPSTRPIVSSSSPCRASVMPVHQSCRCISHAHAHGSTDSAKAKAHLRHRMCAGPRCQRQHPAPPDRARYMQSAWGRRDPRR